MISTWGGGSPHKEYMTEGDPKGKLNLMAIGQCKKCE